MMDDDALYEICGQSKYFSNFHTCCYQVFILENILLDFFDTLFLEFADNIKLFLASHKILLKFWQMTFYKKKIRKISQKTSDNLYSRHKGIETERV